MTNLNLLILQKSSQLMNKYIIKHLTLTLIFTLSPLLANAQQNVETADRIVAIVNDVPILKSEVDADVTNFIQQAKFANNPVEFTDALWYDVLEAAIDNKVMYRKAIVDSIEVTQDRVDRQMDQRIQQLVQQAGSERALEEAFGKSIIQLRAEYREQFREQIMTSQLRQQKLSEIEITRPEVEEFFNSIPKDSLPIIPEQVSLSQIVILPDPLLDAKENARSFAEQLRDSILNHGKSIEEFARKYSDGPSASNGGSLPLMNVSELVPEYSAAAAALQPGQISEVLETVFGYHVIRLDDRRGNQIKTSHILISVDENELDEQAAIDRLNEMRDSLMTNEGLKFSDFARKYSEDPNTASTGGKLIDPQTGSRLIPLQNLDPALYRIVLLMDQPGQISEPKAFNPNNANSGKAYRIVRLDSRIEEHTASLEKDYDRIETIALQQKQIKVMSEWMQNVRDEMYIEYKIPVPESLKQSSK